MTTTTRDLLDRDLGRQVRRQLAAQRRQDQDLGLAIAAEAVVLFAAVVIALLAVVTP